jgi:phosphatidylglycerol lysyltransferase
MGFTLGGLDQLNDPHIRCLIAVGADGKVHGITSWMPVYASGRPVGWTLDLMRRNTEAGAFRGVMEFLIATAALTFGQEGAGFVSLSGAPLACLDRGERPSAPQRLLDMIATIIEPVYGFQSLLQFKAKFQPVYQPLYLAYPDPAALGSIAAAIGRAYLPRLTLRQALHMLTKLRWADGCVWRPHKPAIYTVGGRNTTRPGLSCPDTRRDREQSRQSLSLPGWAGRPRPQLRVPPGGRR